MKPLNTELSQTLTMILAGGQGERLMPLTVHRAKPAVPFGGLYRIIDFTLSNCIHSGLRRIYCLTQYQARSLEEHLRFGWGFLPRRLGQFITARPPTVRGGSNRWYEGTADAIYHNLDTVEEEQPARVLILSGDHIYKMDYGSMLAEHIENEAELTIAAIRVPVTEARRFGVFQVDQGGRVVAFEEKPEAPAEIPDQPGYSLASMGVYLFETDELRRRLLEDAVRADSTHDFGKDVIPRMIGGGRVYAHHFIDVEDPDEEPYWRDIGTLDSYYDANMDLCKVRPQFNLYSKNWPTFTRQHAEPPAKTVFADPPGPHARRAEVLDSLLCPGVVVSGGRVSRSILSYVTRVNSFAVVEDSILLAGVEVGRGARIRRAIIDKWARIPAGMEIGFDHEADAARFKVTDSGITVVPRNFQVESEAQSG